MRIRPFQEEDREKVLDLCDEFWSKNFPMWPFDRDHTTQRLDLYLSTGVCLVLDDISGLMLLTVNSLPCSPILTAADVMWYVNEKNRSNGAGLELLDATIRYCKKQGITSLSMALMESSNPERARKIYEERGFKLRETTYHMVI